MAYQNMIHRTTTPGNTVITTPDGKVYRVLSYNGGTFVTPSVGRHQPHVNLASPSQSSQTLSSIITGGQASPMATNGSLAQPKQQKVPCNQSRPATNAEQTEKLMSLLLYKDNQIAALTTRVESLRTALDRQSLQEKKGTLSMNDLKSELDAKQKENILLSHELADVKAGKKKVVNEKIKLEKHLNGKFTEMNQKISNLEGEVETLRKAKVEIWDAKRDLTQKLEASEARCRSKGESLEKVTKNLSEAKAMAQRVDQEKRKLESEKRKLEKSKEEAFETVQVLRKVVQQKESRIDLLQGKMKEMVDKSGKAASCNCLGKQEKKDIKQQLQEKEESEARLGDMLAKMKSQISCLGMEKEKARTQMISAWESESNLRSELEQEKAAREKLERELKQLGNSDDKAKEGASGNAKAITLGLYKAKNAKLKKQIRELEQKLSSVGDHQEEIPGEEKEKRCKKLYKDLVKYKVSPANCKKVTQCVLKNLLDRSMELPGKEFAWSAQQENPPTPHVSDEEEADGPEEVDNDIFTVSDDDGSGEDDSDSADETAPTSPDRRKVDLTKKLDHYGGLWCTPKEMENQLKALDKKVHEEAVIVQLQYRSVVLELAREGKLLHSSLTGKQKPYAELKTSLLRLIKQNEMDSIKHQEDFMKEISRREAIVEEELTDLIPSKKETPEERKRMCSPGPDHPILRPRKRHSSKRTARKTSFENLHGKLVEHFVYDSSGCRDWQKGVVIDQARSSISILYEFAKDSPVKISLKDAREDFDKGDLVACEVNLEDFVDKVIENLWEMDNGVTEWYKGHVLKMGVQRGEDTEFEVAYGGSLDDEFYYVPLLKDYWCNEVRIASL